MLLTISYSHQRTRLPNIVVKNMSSIILEFEHILFTYDKLESVKFGFSISYLFSKVL